MVRIGAMDSNAIDPVGFRETQQKQWNSAAIGGKECSEVTESAAAHVCQRLV